jgi:hypothetical protein
LAKVFGKVQLPGDGGPLFSMKLTKQLVLQKYIILLALPELSPVSDIAISCFGLSVIILVYL